MEYLPLTDLYNVAEVCESLNRLAKYPFRMKCKDSISEDLHRFDDDDFWDFTDLNQLQQTLRIFGEEMSTLDIINKYGEDTSMEVMEVLCLINQYCGQNMNTLRLHRFNGLQLGKVEPLLSYIKELAIICCH